MHIAEVNAKLATSIFGPDDFTPEKVLPLVESASEAVLSDPHMAPVCRKFGVTDAAFKKIYTHLISHWAKCGFEPIGIVAITRLLSAPASLEAFFNLLSEMLEKNALEKKHSDDQVMQAVAVMAYAAWSKP